MAMSAEVAASPGEVRVVVCRPLGRLVLARPGKHNACTAAMWRSLPERISELVTGGVSLISIEGEGSSFCAGADLAEVRAATATLEASRDYCEMVTAALVAIARSPVPTVAAIRGAAAGGGCEIALAADLRYCASSARLQLPLARLGVVPDRLTVRRLTQIAGPGVARRMLLGGAPVDAAECVRCGLAEVALPDTELDEAVMELATLLAGNSPHATRGIKDALLAEEGLAALPGLSARMVTSMASADLARSADKFLARTRSTDERSC
jgi:enoyl-CoA hydratase/carnithine racemase